MSEYSQGNSNEEATFAAPWGKLVKIMTALSVLMLVGVALIGVFMGPRESVLWILSMVVMPPAMLVITAFFMVRGYRLTPNALFVRRLGWETGAGDLLVDNGGLRRYNWLGSRAGREGNP